MRKDIQDALLSVAEVAVFAWSLLELLLTRILPLAGFLAGHLLLQFCRLLASVVIPAASAGRRKLPEAEYFSDVQAEEVIDGDHQNDSESWKSSSDKLQEKQIILKESLILASSTHEEADADVQASGMPITDAAVTTIPDATTDAAAELEEVHVSESVPSDAAANEVPVRGSDYGPVANETDLGSNVADVVGEEQRHVSANLEGTKASDVQRNSTEGEMRKSRRRMRVLPPSLSQVKRTLMQKSRRASTSPSPSPAGSTPSPMKKKHNFSPRSRNFAVKSSSSFMSKFRKQFLLDPA